VLAAQRSVFAQELLARVHHDMLAARAERDRKNADVASMLLDKMEQQFATPVPPAPPAPPAPLPQVAFVPASREDFFDPASFEDEVPTLVDAAPGPLDAAARAEVNAIAPITKRAVDTLLGWFTKKPT
jgi:hypothetical protein